MVLIGHFLPELWPFICSSFDSKILCPQLPLQFSTSFDKTFSTLLPHIIYDWSREWPLLPELRPFICKSLVTYCVLKSAFSFRPIFIKLSRYCNHILTWVRFIAFMILQFLLELGPFTCKFVKSYVSNSPISFHSILMKV